MVFTMCKLFSLLTMQKQTFFLLDSDSFVNKLFYFTVLLNNVFHQFVLNNIF